MKSPKATALKPVHPIHQRLQIVWAMWLIYRLIGVAILTHVLVNKNVDIVGGIAWQGVWLIPALMSTPFILKGKSPYALLVISMLSLVYLGGSGMILLTNGFADNGALFTIGLVDFVLLALINYWLFILLKRLPKMNA